MLQLDVILIHMHGLLEKKLVNELVELERNPKIRLLSVQSNNWLVPFTVMLVGFMVQTTMVLRVVVILLVISYCLKKS